MSESIKELQPEDLFYLYDNIEVDNSSIEAVSDELKRRELLADYDA